MVASTQLKSPHWVSICGWTSRTFPGQFSMNCGFLPKSWWQAIGGSPNMRLSFRIKRSDCSSLLNGLTRRTKPMGGLITDGLETVGLAKRVSWFVGHGNVVQRVLGIGIPVIEIRKKPVDEHDHPPLVEPCAREAVKQYLTAKRPFAAVGSNFNFFKPCLLQQPAQAIFREPEEIVRFFMQVPIHRTRQNQNSVRSEHPMSFRQQRAMISDVFDDLRADDGVKTCIWNRDCGCRADYVHPLLTRLDHIASRVAGDFSSKHFFIGFIATTDVQQSTVRTSCRLLQISKKFTIVQKIWIAKTCSIITKSGEGFLGHGLRWRICHLE